MAGKLPHLFSKNYCTCSSAAGYWFIRENFGHDHLSALRRLYALNLCFLVEKLQLDWDPICT